MQIPKMPSTNRVSGRLLLAGAALMATALASPASAELIELRDGIFDLADPIADLLQVLMQDG
jgi:hypothetical protein